MSNKNKPPELSKINQVLNTSYEELLKLIPITNSRNYKSNIKKCVKKVLDYDLQISKESLIDILKLVENKRKDINSILVINRLDMVDIKKDYYKTNRVLYSYIRSRYESNYKETDNIELAENMTLYDANSTSSYVHPSIKLFKNTEERIKAFLCDIFFEIRKKEVMLKILKKIKYHIQYCLSKYC